MGTTNNRFYREPAFPSITKSYVADDGDTMHQGANGMSLRDYFAAKELSKVDCVEVCDVQGAYDRLADHCYRMADAMLRARGAA
ncbi:hypothetical protein [Burkholderia multivorans]|uniref:hypothetical protein n=1 Tax=Burkholderia multivorans TaxID=87883 RepID=UPI000CFE442D|nr:hypothetical protein [Burkholderia multivorans]PRE20318.1 hypothetical protein C6P78_03765 [Burkholderia multivorans]